MDYVIIFFLLWLLWLDWCTRQTVECIHKLLMDSKGSDSEVTRATQQLKGSTDKLEQVNKQNE